jgi:hypothetical protein
MLGFRARNLHHVSLASGRTAFRSCGADPSKAKKRLSPPTALGLIEGHPREDAAPVVCYAVPVHIQSVPGPAPFSVQLDHALPPLMRRRREENGCQARRKIRRNKRTTHGSARFTADWHTHHTRQCTLHCRLAHSPGLLPLSSSSLGSAAAETNPRLASAAWPR